MLQQYGSCRDDVVLIVDTIVCILSSGWFGGVWCSGQLFAIARHRQVQRRGRQLLLLREPQPVLELRAQCMQLPLFVVSDEDGHG